jgi:hypothetical protein
VLEDEPTPLRAIVPAAPVELERTILKALSRDPADRHASAEDLAAALKPFTKKAE